MLEIKLTIYGLEGMLKAVRDDLDSVSGKRVSKKNKDKTINRAVGALGAMYRLILVEEANYPVAVLSEKEDEEEEEDEE